MIRTPIQFCLASFLALSIFAAAWADYPKPSPYPISWELNFEPARPTRIVVPGPNGSSQAYWYLTYSVTNNSGQERMFLPVFEMLTKDGQVIRSDNNIPRPVFDAIKAQEKRKFLESFPAVEGSLRIGEDQSRDGVAIWREVEPRMGEFSIFASNLSGETALVKDDSGKPMNDANGEPIILRKTLEIDYIIRGDGSDPNTPVVEKTRTWVMR